jgi:hypothetical protein
MHLNLLSARIVGALGSSMSTTLRWVMKGGRCGLGGSGMSTHLRAQGLLGGMLTGAASPLIAQLVSDSPGQGEHELNDISQGQRPTRSWQHSCRFRPLP